LAYSDLHKIDFSEIDRIELRKNDFMRSEFADRMYNLAKQNYEAKQPISHLIVDELKKCAENGELVGFHPEYLAVRPKPFGFDHDRILGGLIVKVKRDCGDDDFMIDFKIKFREREDEQIYSENAYCIWLSADGRVNSIDEYAGLPMFTRLKTGSFTSSPRGHGKTKEAEEKTKEPTLLTADQIRERLGFKPWDEFLEDQKKWFKEWEAKGHLSKEELLKYRYRRTGKTTKMLINAVEAAQHGYVSIHGAQFCFDVEYTNMAKRMCEKLGIDPGMIVGRREQKIGQSIKHFFDRWRDEMKFMLDGELPKTTLDPALDGGRRIEVLHGTTIPAPHGTLKNQRIQDRWGGELYKVKQCKNGCYETGCMCPRDKEE
jgi:hypothetical protein